MIPLARKRKGAKYGISMYEFYPLGEQAPNPRTRLDQLRPSFCFTELRRAGAGGKADDGCEHAFSHALRQERGCAETTR